MILAGDVGGTKTLLGLFDAAPLRPEAVNVATFSTADFDGLPALVSAFLAQHGGTPRIDAACFGVAGPIVDQTVQMTNVAWSAGADEIRHAFDVPQVRLLNDLEAMAWAVPVLRHDELHPLQWGTARPGGNAALIASGTGLGESILHHVDGAFRPIASEGGHTDFAARNARELELVRMLLRASPRVDLERVVSGPGIVNLYRFTHDGGTCDEVGSPDEADAAPAAISQAAMDGRCVRCAEAMEMYVSSYGAAAGNLALRAMATAGVFLGGGIAPKVLPLMEQGGFVEAFNDKGPMRPLLEAMPVQVILNPKAALLGAAVYANGMIQDGDRERGTGSGER
jgi:glucokinase